MSPALASHRRRLTPLLAILAVALAAAGCGGSGKPKPATPSPEAQVRTAWRAAAADAAAGSGSAFCARVTPAGQEKITAATNLPCPDSIRLLASQLTPADKQTIGAAKITAVTVTGDNAVVEYVSSPGLAKYGFTGRTELTKTGDRWLLQGI